MGDDYNNNGDDYMQEMHSRTGTCPQQCKE